MITFHKMCFLFVYKSIYLFIAEMVAQICKFCNIFSRYVKKNETHFFIPIP